GQRRLVALLRQLRSPWRLTLFGSVDHDPDEVAALQTEIAYLPVAVRGAANPEQLAEAYASHDLFVSLSASESYGMAAAEAAAAGLPVFALATGELASFTAPAARWLLPRDADDGAVSERLATVVADPEAVRALRGQAFAGEPRSWQVVADEFAAACSQR
ncbi:MAG: glycosyltransferase, partial [Planctomycetes bacterium]|nr:glycosyltransferase [Planctomycetota bacterium]